MDHHLSVMALTSLTNAWKSNVIDTFFFLNHYLAYILIPLCLWFSYNALGQTYLGLKNTAGVDILGWLNFYAAR